ncbi:MAG: argininosuccinate synthase [Chlamydiales bacterium]|nr:argininosuccinate synthase [Chlamydiales bacterium]
MAKVVLAYKGDNHSQSVLKWLIKRGDEVVCFIVDIGQDIDLVRAESEARRAGASDVVALDFQEELLTQFLVPALKANALYEGICFPGEALVAALIAKYQVDCAADMGAAHLCNGCHPKSMGKLRFDLAYKSLLPKVQIVSPWDDPQFVTTLNTGSIKVNSNLLQKTISGDTLERAHEEIDQAIFPSSEDATAVKVTIAFEHGVPTSVQDHSSGDKIEGLLDSFQFLNDIAEDLGIGRHDMVVNRLMGMKWREVYSAPAATLLWAAHRDLEGLVLDKQILQFKEQLSWQIADCIYNGLCFAPEMRVLLSAIEESQEDLTGKVTLMLHRGYFEIVGRESVLSRYCETLNRMEQLEAFNPDDVKGFVHIQGLRLQQRT